MKRYRLFHRITKTFQNIQAYSAQEACQKVGWLIGETWVRELTPTVHDPTSESGHSGGGWRNITPAAPSEQTLRR